MIKTIWSIISSLFYKKPEPKLIGAINIINSDNHNQEIFLNLLANELKRLFYEYSSRNFLSANIYHLSAEIWEFNGNGKKTVHKVCLGKQGNQVFYLKYE